MGRRHVGRAGGRARTRARARDAGARNFRRMIGGGMVVWSLSALSSYVTSVLSGGGARGESGAGAGAMAAAPTRVPPAFITARLVLLRQLGVLELARKIEAFRRPQRCAIDWAPTHKALRSIPCVWRHHLSNPGEEAAGRFRVKQCARCHEITEFEFYRVHPPTSSLSYFLACGCPAQPISNAGAPT